MIYFKEYIIKVESEKYPFFDIKNIDIRDIKEIGNGSFEVNYDFSVVSRMDSKWSLNRREKRVLNLMQIREERINQILDV
jgi:hypothetical protein